MIKKLYSVLQHCCKFHDPRTSSTWYKGGKLPKRYLLTYSTWHTIVMRIQCRLQLLKKAKGKCIQFFWQIHGWSCTGILISILLWPVAFCLKLLSLTLMDFYGISSYDIKYYWILFYINFQIELLIKIIYETYLKYFIIAEIGDGPLAKIPESNKEDSSFLHLYWFSFILHDFQEMNLNIDSSYADELWCFTSVYFLGCIETSWTTYRPAVL